MRETAKTAIWLGVAALLATLAAVTEPERVTPEILSDQGEPFYPGFRDPEQARVIEVIDYDEATATARPLKIEFRRGRWVVASHHNYPVELGDRLARHAAGLVDLRKDMVRSDSADDHAQFGVIDPLETRVTSLAGRGKRITLRDARGDVLADYIFGKPVEGKPGYRYVRVPGRKRTYMVRTEADPSARLTDWVEPNLLRLSASALRRIVLQMYAIDETFGRVTRSETLPLVREGGGWSGAEKLPPGSLQPLLDTLERLRIVDVRPKPPSVAQDLRQGQVRLSLESALSFRQYGFFLTPQGRLLAKEGELSVETDDGLVYVLRFGEVATSGGEIKSAGGRGENRFLMVTVSHDPARASKYGGDGASGERRAKELNQRFADWYYVISGADFERLRPGRKESAPAGGAVPGPAQPPASPKPPSAGESAAPPPAPSQQQSQP
ncbi:MAG: DUF4340 domain-containing protein [Bryobacterales bacterium]|nr:DUF4340 domain-containing protein [Bryobacterales bacterium]